jgi:hypothetical protein
VTNRADGTDRRTLVTLSIIENLSWSPDGAYAPYDRIDFSEPSQPKCALYKAREGVSPRHGSLVGVPE